MKALIVVDMLEDFVAGALANPLAERIVGPLRALLAHAREQGWVIVFSNDAHEPGDPELAIWGEHAMAGTPGARVISELEPHPSSTELVCPKRSYGAFDGTDLDERLRTLGVSEIILTGQHTNICVRHSAYGAFLHGFGITVARDAVCALEGVDEQEAVDYLESVYGARIATVDELRGQKHVSALAAETARRTSDVGPQHRRLDASGEARLRHRHLGQNRRRDAVRRAAKPSDSDLPRHSEPRRKGA